MRRWSFIVAVLGIFLLVYLLGVNGKEVDSLDGMIEGSKVWISGVVGSEKSFGDFSVMDVDGIEVVCSCSGFKGKDVIIEGVVEVYEGEKQLRVLEIVESVK